MLMNLIQDIWNKVLLDSVLQEFLSDSKSVLYRFNILKAYVGLILSDPFVKIEQAPIIIQFLKFLDLNSGYQLKHVNFLQFLLMTLIRTVIYRYMVACL